MSSPEFVDDVEQSSQTRDLVDDISSRTRDLVDDISSQTSELVGGVVKTSSLSSQCCRTI